MPGMLSSRGYQPRTRRSAAMTAARQAPVVPTTNLSPQQRNVTQAVRTRRAQQQEQAQPTGTMTGMTSGAPGTSSGMANGGGINVSGPGQRANVTFGKNASLVDRAMAGQRIPDSTGGGQAPPGSPARNALDKFDDKSHREMMDHDPTNDEAADDRINDLLTGGPRDTSEDEALIRQLMLEQAGAGQADLNARLGAAGFGTSGALGTMTSDLRQQAALKAARDIMDVRQTARDDHFRDVGLGLESEFQDRGMDLTEEQYAQYMDILEAMYGPEPSDRDTADQMGNSPLWQEVQENGMSYEADPGVVQQAQDAPWDSFVNPFFYHNSRYLGEDANYTYVQLADGRIVRVPNAG